jgi:hypothetical protein
VHGRHEKAGLRCELLTQAANTPQQLTILRAIDQCDHPISDFQPERVDRHHIGPRDFRTLLTCGLDDRRLHHRHGTAPLQPVGEARDASGDQQECEMRHAGDQAEHAEQNGHDVEHLRTPAELLDELLIQVLVGGHARDQHTGRSGNDQRRQLRHQAIADGEKRVILRGLRKREIVLHRADREPADDVDQHDDDAGDRIAAHELARAVHGTVELRFLGDLCAAAARLLLGDQAGVQIGVDGHLLAGHGIEGEARRDFGDTPGAFGDHHEVDDHEHDEDDDSDRVVAADQKVAERFDHLAGRIRAGMSVEQDHARGRHVERKPQQRGHQQDGGEQREIERFVDVDCHQYDQQRDRDIEREQQVEDDRRQRQHHHRKDQHDQNRPGELTHRRALDGDVGFSHFLECLDLRRKGAKTQRKSKREFVFPPQPFA